MAIQKVQSVQGQGTPSTQHSTKAENIFLLSGKAPKQTGKKTSPTKRG